MQEIRAADPGARNGGRTVALVLMMLWVPPAAAWAQRQAAGGGWEGGRRDDGAVILIRSAANDARYEALGVGGAITPELELVCKDGTTDLLVGPFTQVQRDTRQGQLGGAGGARLTVIELYPGTHRVGVSFDGSDPERTGFDSTPHDGVARLEGAEGLVARMLAAERMAIDIGSGRSRRRVSVEFDLTGLRLKIAQLFDPCGWLD